MTVADLGSVDHRMTGEQRALRDSLRAYLASRVEPLVADCEERGAFPANILPDLAEFGCTGGIVPEERGGQGLGYLDLALLMEEVGYRWMSLRSTLSVINMVALILDRGADQVHRSHYLAPLIAGEKIAWFGLSEPDHGSDLRRLDTVATEDGNGDYRISGTKLWITNGVIGDFGVLLARVRRADGTEAGPTAFLIDPQVTPFEARRIETMFLKATTTSELVFDASPVPRGKMLGVIGEGMGLFMRGLDLGRLNVAMGAVGAARRALDMATSYARTRRTFDKRIGEHQLVQELIADIRVQVSAARALAYSAAEALETGAEGARRVCAEAKLFATESALLATDKALQVHGGIGLSVELGLERMFRDARGATIVEGTSQIQRLVIAREQLGLSAFN